MVEEEKSVLDAAVAALVDAVQTLDEVKDGLWAVAIILDKISTQMENLTDKGGALKVSIDYEKLGDQIAAALGQVIVETSEVPKIEFQPPVKPKTAGAK